MNLLSADVNDHIERYMAAYKELKDLAEVFRAYVASVAIIRQDSSLCPSLQGLPLYDSEKVAAPLPEFNPNEVFLDVVMYVSNDGRRRNLRLSSANEIDGGVTLRAKELYEESTTAVETQVMADLTHEFAAPTPDVAKAVWTGGSGREFILLNLRPDAELWQPYTPQMAVAGAPISIRRASNRSFHGESYKSFTGTSYAQCEQLCRKEGECVALQFEKSARACELFDTLGDVADDQTTDIAIKSAMLPR